VGDAQLGTKELNGAWYCPAGQVLKIEPEAIAVERLIHLYPMSSNGRVNDN